MNDTELLNLIRAGRESAFKILVETHQKRVFNTVLAIVQNFEEAEDIAQEVFIEVYQSVNKFRGDSKLSTWLYRIATTKALEEIRKKKAQKRFAFFTNLFNDNNEVLHEPVEFEHPGVVLENKERSKQLFKAINQLPDNQKIAYTLCNIEGLSYQEITEVMEVSLSSVESLLFRAKTNLKKSLHDLYFSQKI
jgi:RNA polymerase sigma factor (sigma-70 family)